MLTILHTSYTCCTVSLPPNSSWQAWDLVQHWSMQPNSFKARQLAQHRQLLLNLQVRIDGKVKLAQARRQLQHLAVCHESDLSRRVCLCDCQCVQVD